MARQFGKLLCSVWDDPAQEDFLALSSDAKVLFWAFCSQKDITAAGIVPLTERRWRRWFGGSADAVETAFQALLDGGWILADDDTAEVWVRSFIKIDARLENANLAKSVHSAVVEIRSEKLREACRRTLDQLIAETPGRTPFGGRSDAVSRPSARAPELQASSNGEQEPAASSQQRADEPSDAFTAVVDSMIGMRLRQETNIRNPGRYRSALKRDLPVEHRTRIVQLLEQFPGAPVSAIAAAVLTGETRSLAGYAQS